MVKDQLINQFKSLHQEMINLVYRVNPEDREKVLFDKWSLKDILIHITAWNKNDYLRFKMVQNNQDPIVTWVDDLDQFNDQVVEKNRKLNWEDVQRSFIDSGKNLTNIAEQLAYDKWNTNIDPKEKMTLEEDFIKAIEHYRDEHIPQLKNLNT